jgi:nucleoside-triphosphatase
LKVFITGRPGVGKSTVLKKVQELLLSKGYRVGGVSCPEMRREGVRVGFKIVDVSSGRTGILSQIGFDSGPRIGKYVVNLPDLEEVGVKALDIAVREADVVLIDEVGPMEMQSKLFQEAVLRTLSGQKQVIGILHWRMEHPVISAIKARSDLKILEVTHQNRDVLPSEIVDRFVREVSKRY